MGSTEQTKIGNLIVEGVLRLGQFTTVNAPAGVEGALYFDTTEKKTKVYSSAAWSDLGGGWNDVLSNYTTIQRDALSPTDGFLVYNTTEGKVQAYSSGIWRNISAKLSLAQTCTLDGDCDSTHCINGYCCDTGCAGNCQRCNVAGSIGTCTDVASDCTGNCDVCSSGNCAATVALCTGNCDQCTGSGTVYNCAASVALCTGNCDTCSGSGTAYNCAADATICTGNCDVCSGSGTAFNCAASASLCTATCTECTGAGTAYSCSPVASGQSGLNCTATHYRCDGAGTCAAPTTSPIWYVNVGSGFSCSVYCFNKNMSCNGGRMVRLSDGYIWYYGCSDTLIGDYGTARTNDCACAAYLYN